MTMWQEPQQSHATQEAFGSGASAVGSDAAGPMRSRLPAGLAMLGAGVVLAAVTVAGTLVENRPQDFNWSAFSVGLVGTVLLLGGSAVLIMLDRPARSASAAVLGAFGLLGVTVLWLSWLQPRHGDWPVYLAGLFLVLAGALGWVLLRGSALLVIAGLGGLLLLGQAASDLVGDSSGTEDGRGPTFWVAFAFALYSLVFAAALWWLPSRHVTGLTGITVAVAAMIAALYLMSLFTAFDSVASFDAEGNRVPPERDISWYAVAAMVVGLLICLAALALWALSRHVGYAVVGVLGALILVPSGIAAAAPDAGLRWATGVGVLGALTMAAGLLPAFLSRRRQPVG